MLLLLRVASPISAVRKCAAFVACCFPDFGSFILFCPVGWHIFQACLAFLAGYLYAQKLSSVTLGLAIGASGLTGLIAAFIFTRVRKRMGLERTGLLAFSLEIACLVLVVASVWAPGTIFDPSCLSGECHNEESPSTDCHKSGNNTLCTVQGPVSQDLNGTLEDGVKETAYSVMDGLNNSRTSNDTQATSPPHDRTSAALFLTGFITSRVGT